MQHAKKYLCILLLLPTIVHAQYYNKKYVKDLRYRLLLSYFQEYRSIDVNIKPIKAFDSLGKENLILSSSANLLSGLLIQTNNSSMYLAGTTPQTDADIKKFGKQSSKIFKIAVSQRAIFTSFNYVKNDGLYDRNYSKHPEFLNDTLSYLRYNSSNVTWINFDINYYKNHRTFAIGMPTYFGLRQLRSKFTLAGRLSYNYLDIDNANRSFFRDSLTNQFTALSVSKYTFNGVNLSVSPSLHLVAFKKLFLYTDISFGIDVGSVKSKSPTTTSTKGYANVALSQAKIVGGYHGDRFIASLYYSFLNQSFKTAAVTAGGVYHTFGFIIGYRINLYKNLPWEKDI
jgi:hypothetical protein